MKEFKIENHASSYLPKEKNWTLVWQDEFDGNELDESKWNFREYFWGKKSPNFTIVVQKLGLQFPFLLFLDIF